MAKSKTTIAKPAATSTENKKDKVLALLRAETGASISDMTGATGWLAHTTRAMLTGLRKKGFTLDKTRADGGTRYKIAAEPAA